LKEFPEVFTQGTTLDEVKENISDALEMYFEDLREKYEPQGKMIEETEMVL
jgi:predicted RNase H-like HicB family nuclease